MIKLLRKKPKLMKIMVYKKITECSKYYLVHNLKTKERKVVRKFKKGKCR